LNLATHEKTRLQGSQWCRGSNGKRRQQVVQVVVMVAVPQFLRRTAAAAAAARIRHCNQVLLDIKAMQSNDARANMRVYNPTAPFAQAIKCT
jgi:site-specific recombinase